MSYETVDIVVSNVHDDLIDFEFCGFTENKEIVHYTLRIFIWQKKVF